MAAAPVIFITGASGYIGGNTLIQVVEKHPEWMVNALVRDEEQAKVIKGAFPSVNTVLGNLDDHDLLVSESAKADIILNLASADIIPAIQSYLEGLSKRPESARRYLIHTSGSGILADFSTGEGNEAPRVYSDVSDVKEITSFDETHFHRDVDKAVTDGGLAKNVKTAIVSPPTIYGIGKGPLKKRSIQIPAFISGTLERGKSFTIGAGQNVWDLVHIDDLGSAYLLLVEQALKEGGGNATWGPEGYYFVETGEYRWKQIADAVAAYAVPRGLVTSSDLDELTGKEASKIHPWGPLIWGSNARGKADRLRSLGWKSQAPDVYHEIPSMVEFELAK